MVSEQDVLNYEQIIYSEKFVIKTKKDKCLFIFPEIPYWLIAKKELEDILFFFEDGKTIFEYIKLIKNNEKDIYLIRYLIQKKILYTNKTSVSIANSYGINNFIFGITNKCNLRCKSCYNSYSEALLGELNSDEIKKMIDDIAPYLNDGFSISGGEPFCRKKELYDTLYYVSKKIPNIKLGIVTNGTLIDEEDAKLLSSYDNLTVQISLDGATLEAHEYNRGRGSFHKVVNSIKLLKKHNVNILIGTLLTKKNISEVKKMLDFALENNISSVRFIEMFWQGKSRSKDMERPLAKDLFPIYKELINLNSQYASLLQKDVIKLAMDYYRNPIKRKCCGVEDNSMFIDSNGDVYPCNLLVMPEYKYGNIKTTNIKDLFESKARKKICTLNVDDFEECEDCELRYFCGGGCRGVAREAKGRINTSDPNCTERREAIYSYLWEFGETNSLWNLLACK